DRGVFTSLPLPEGDGEMLRIIFESSDFLTDDDLRRLQNLKGIRQLRLHGCKQITDEGVKHIRNLKSLRSLCLVRTAAISKSVESIVSLTELTSLDCPWGITDEQLIRVCQLTKLNAMYLANST